MTHLVSWPRLFLRCFHESSRGSHSKSKWQRWFHSAFFSERSLVLVPVVAAGCAKASLQFRNADLGRVVVVGVVAVIAPLAMVLTAPTRSHPDELGCNLPVAHRVCADCNLAVR